MKYYKNGFFPLRHEIIDSNRYRRLGLAAQSLYIHLCRIQNWTHKGKRGDFEVSDWELILASSLGEKTIREARKELVEGGFIEVSKSAPRKPTRYTILAPS